METSRISVFYRSLIVLAGMLLAQLIVLGYQLRTQTDIPLVRFGTVLIVEPINRSMNAVSAAIRGVWFGYIDLRNAREENEQLSAKINELKIANQRLEAAQKEVQRLRSLFALKTLVPVETVVARVIGGSAGEASRLLMIDKGANVGIRRDSPVMVSDGVVGKVLAVFPTSSQVILLSDPFSGAGVLLEQSRLHGVLKGRNEDLLYLDFIPNGEQIALGQRVFTSGEDKIYPPGLPVGVVESAAPGQKFLDVRVRPLAPLQSLEEVLVILRSDFELPLPEPTHLGPTLPTATTTGLPGSVKRDATSTAPTPAASRGTDSAAPPSPPAARAVSRPAPSPTPPAPSPDPSPQPSEASPNAVPAPELPQPTPPSPDPSPTDQPQ